MLLGRWGQRSQNDNQVFSADAWAYCAAGESTLEYKVYKAIIYTATYTLC